MTWLTDLEGLEGRTALDVCCGSGTLAVALADRYGAVHGIDRAPALTRARAAERVTYAAMDAEALDFPDGHFDLVGISWSLHHLANPTRVLLEMHRVLAPGGAFLIVEPIAERRGTNQDLHLDAHGLIAEADRLRGEDHFPIFQRMQVGSLIQGLNLERVEFHPIEALQEEADWDVAQCREAAAPWVTKLGDLATDMTLPAGLRERAGALAERVADEGIRTSFTMRTFGFKPATV